MNPNIDILFSPKSVAVIGASNNPNKWGNWIAEQVLLDQNIRDVYFVNSVQQTVLGKQTFKSISELPETLDVAVVAVADKTFDKTIDELLAHKTKVIIVINVGFSECGNIERECNLIKKVRQAGTLLVGPNCAGVWDSYSKFRCLPIATFSAGPVALISQSGGLITDVYHRLKELSLGFSKAISIGNSADLSVSDLIEYLDGDPNTKVIALHLENENLIPHNAIKKASKPIVLLVPNLSSSATRAAKQHTNSKLSHSSNCTHTIQDFVASIQGALSNKKLRLSDKRVIIVTDSGGMGVLAASAADHIGLRVDELSKGLKSAIHNEIGHILPRAVLSNPIDLINVPGGFSDVTVQLLKLLEYTKDVDGIIMILFLIETEKEHDIDYNVGTQLATIVHSGDKPVVFVCKDFTFPGTQALLHNYVPVCRDVETAARVMRSLCGY